MHRRTFLAAAGLGLAFTHLDARAGAARRPDVAPPEPAPADRWERLRAEFDLAPDKAHLAGFLFASHPRPVREAIERHRQALDDDPVTYLYSNNRRFNARVRQVAARYLGTRPLEIALTDSTTMGLGLVYNAIAVKDGQELLTTTHDHFATHEALGLRAGRCGATLRKVPLYRDISTVSVDELTGTLAASLRPETRVVAVTWVHSSTGLKLPIRAFADAIAEVNRGRDEDDRVLLCVDGVHGLGIEDVTLPALGCDVFIAGTHKSLFGPRGTGIVWANAAARGALSATIPSFSRRYGWGGQMTPGGFHSFEHRWALAEAFELHLDVGKAAIEERVRTLCRHAKEELAKMKHVELATPLADELSAGLISFNVRGMVPRAVVRRLGERGIIASRAPYERSYARIAPGLLNNLEDVDRALRAIRALA